MPTDSLKSVIKTVLPEVECVIAWGAGPDPLHHAPLFIRTEADLDRLHSGFLAVHNTALFLPEYKGKKVGLVVKGCDARSVGQLLSEKLIQREDIVVIGLPCKGIIDHAKIEKLLHKDAELGTIEEIKETDTSLEFTASGHSYSILKAEVLADKCKRCTSANAHFADHFVGEKVENPASSDDYSDLEEFEKLSFEERQEFWNKEMSKCIRCYACRNACPLCVCREHCVATSRNPAWLSQQDTTEDKLFFQIIHATHLAGRCTGCGECQRACPVGIPVLLFKRGLNRSVEKLFSYRAGIDEGTPPLLSFSIEEPTIKEKDW